MVEANSDQTGYRLRQLAVFLPNRLGELLALHRVLDGGAIRVLGLTVVDGADHAVVRLIVDQPTLAAATIREQGYAVVETDVLCVSFGADLGIRRLLTAVLVAEVNIHYVYPLLQPVNGRSLLALYVDDPLAAARLLTERGLKLVDQGDFSSESF